MHTNMGSLGHVTRLARQKQEHAHRFAIGHGRHVGRSALRSVGLNADADGGQHPEIAPAPSERDRVVDRTAAGIQYDGRAAELPAARDSSKSLGLSAVTIPTALTRPRQFGWQRTQLNFIGNLRPSNATPARAEPPNKATDQCDAK